MIGDVGAVAGPLAVLALVYALGGLHGLLLAWSQEARMHRWAGGVHRLYLKAVEAEERNSR